MKLEMTKGEMGIAGGIIMGLSLLDAFGEPVFHYLKDQVILLERKNGLSDKKPKAKIGFNVSD